VWQAGPEDRAGPPGTGPLVSADSPATGAHPLTDITTDPIRPAPVCPALIDLAEKSAHFFAGLGSTATWDERRTAYLAMSKAFVPERPPGVASRDELMPTPAAAIRCRIYTPGTRCHDDAAPQPAFVYFHGGGFTYGSIESHDTVVADLVHATGLTAISVDYRLAPEHRCPAALTDAISIFEAIHANAGGLGIDPNRIVLAGDSAGATLAAGTAVRQALCPGAPSPRGLALIYPVLGLDFETESYHRNEKALMLTRAQMQHYWGAYLGHDVNEPRTGLPPGAIPNDVPALPEGMPPAAITVAAHDPVASDGIVFYRRLSRLQPGSTLDFRPDLPHGHLRARDVSPSASAAFAWIASAMKRLAHT